MEAPHASDCLSLSQRGVRRRAASLTAYGYRAQLATGLVETREAAYQHFYSDGFFALHFAPLRAQLAPQEYLLACAEETDEQALYDCIRGWRTLCFDGPIAYPGP